jgi:hypothetical protein
MSAGNGDRPERFGVSSDQDWPPKISHFPRLMSPQNSRNRKVLLFVLTYAFGGWKPLKSDSTYPVARVDSSTGISTFIERRDVWAVNLNSDKAPCGSVLLNGIAAKFVLVPLPMSVLRKIPVRSAQPPGVNWAGPSLNDRGDLFWFSADPPDWCGAGGTAALGGCVKIGAAAVPTIVSP